MGKPYRNQRLNANPKHPAQQFSVNSYWSRVIGLYAVNCLKRISEPLTEHNKGVCRNLSNGL